MLRIVCVVLLIAVVCTASDIRVEVWGSLNCSGEVFHTMQVSANKCVAGHAKMHGAATRFLYEPDSTETQCAKLGFFDDYGCKTPSDPASAVVPCGQCTYVNYRFGIAMLQCFSREKKIILHYNCDGSCRICQEWTMYVKKDCDDVSSFMYVKVEELLKCPKLIKRHKWEKDSSCDGDEARPPQALELMKCYSDHQKRSKKYSLQ